jgi:hypothetical protein
MLVMEIKEPQQLNLNDLENWNDTDVEILKGIYNIEYKEDCVALWENNNMIRIADAGDYNYLYEDFIWDNSIEISFNDFMEEFKKGYGNSDYMEISRLFELSNGIWYDEDFC